MSSQRRYKRRYSNQPGVSDRRRQHLGLAGQLGFHLAKLLSDFGHWIAGLFQRKNLESPGEPATPGSPTPPPRGPLVRPAATEPESLPFEKVPGLLTKGERAFWWPLCKAVDGRHLVFCKVRLADVVRCPPDRRDERRWFRKIGRYHCDFVLCDPHTTAPLLVIELDDRRHRRQAGKDRDSFKDAVLRAAEMPVWRVPAQQAYDLEAIRQRIEKSTVRQPKRY